MKFPQLFPSHSILMQDIKTQILVYKNMGNRKKCVKKYEEIKVQNVRH